MNMLTNTTPFGLLSEEVQCLYNSVGRENCLHWNGVWSKCGMGTFTSSVAYRLKLKEGEWYYIKHVVSGFEYYIQFDKMETEAHLKFKQCYDIETGKLDPANEANTDHFDLSQEYSDFRPATTAEIQAVQPEFKKGDVVVDGLDGLLSRKDCSYACHGTIVFADHCFNKNSTKADVKQEKDYELKELKAGKKWNGDGYYDWLTADGLTLNELLKHDLSEIEWRYTDDNNTGLNWGDYSNSIFNDETYKKAIEECFLVGENGRIRLKPEETFVDVEIEWKNNISWDFTDDVSDMLLSTFYRVQDEEKVWMDGAVDFTHDYKKILNKATHARFVKVGK